MDLLRGIVQFVESLSPLAQALTAVITLCIAVAPFLLKLVGSGKRKNKTRANKGGPRTTRSSSKRPSSASTPPRERVRTSSGAAPTSKATASADPTISPTFSPTFSPSFHVHYPAAPGQASVQTNPTEVAASNQAQPTSSAEMPQSPPVSSLPANPQAGEPLRDQPPSSAESSEMLSRSSTSHRDYVHLAPLPEIEQASPSALNVDDNSAPTSIETDAVTMLEPTRDDVPASAEPQHEQPTGDGTRSDSLDIGSAETVAASASADIQAASPSGRLAATQARQQIREQRTNMRRALRHASFIVQEARLSLERYSRTSSSERPFQNEVRILSVLCDYLLSIRDDAVALNSAMNKLDVAWIGGDPRPVLLAYPDPFSEVLRSGDSALKASELRKLLLSTLSNMVATAQGLGHRVVLREYSHPEYPNRSWVYLIPKTYDEPDEDPAAGESDTTMSSSQEHVGDRDLDSTVDREPLDEQG